MHTRVDKTMHYTSWVGKLILSQASICYECRAKRLDPLSPSLLHRSSAAGAMGDGAQHSLCQRQIALPWSNGAMQRTQSYSVVSSAKNIPVLLLARGFAGRHRPEPGFCVLCCLLSCPFSSFFPGSFSFPFSSHKHTHPWFGNEMWRVFTGTEGAGIASWEEIWKLPFAKYLQAMNQQEGGTVIKRSSGCFICVKSEMLVMLSNSQVSSVNS